MRLIIINNDYVCITKNSLCNTFGFERLLTICLPIRVLVSIRLLHRDTTQF